MGVGGIAPPARACVSCRTLAPVAPRPVADPFLLDVWPSPRKALGGGRNDRPSHRHVQQRFSKEETKSPEPYCLYVFSSEAERVPTWTWATQPEPHSPSPAASQPAARPH